MTKKAMMVTTQGGVGNYVGLLGIE